MKIYRQSDREASGWVVVVDGYGADISVCRGHLVIKDGFASEGTLREIYFPRGRCGVRRIIVRAPAGNLSFHSLDWCNRMDIAVAFFGSDSRLINCLVPDEPHDGPIKRAQAIAGVTEDGLVLARWLLARKIESQIHALQVDFSRLGVTNGGDADCAKALGELRSCAAALNTDTTLVALLVREGYAAQCYWRLLAGSTLPWPNWATKRIPRHWTKISPRSTGAKLSVRDATDPFNAMLNYAYTLLEVETRVACAAYGLDPDFGLLHVDDRLRESFIYDLMEPIRASVDVMSFDFAKSKGLRPWMFIELRNGVVRLDPDLARSLAKLLMPKMRKSVMAMAAAYTAKLRHVKVPYRLERPTRLHAPTEKVKAYQPNCEYCKQPLPRRGLKFCNRHCYLRHSVEVRQPIKLAHAKLAVMRQNGLSPGHGGEAAKKRGAKIAESNRRRALSPLGTYRNLRSF